MSRRQIDRHIAPRDLGDDDEGSPILHVDMDAFYASCELRERPDLRGTPVVVGHAGGRGVVLAASYPARVYGVHSAMPMAQALRLCPSATVLPPTFDLYTDVSRAVMTIFAGQTPLVEALSLDEAFLDVSGAQSRPTDIARQIRERVRDEQRITCSVGLAATKFVSKIASTQAKPDGLLVVPAAATLEFLHPLPVSAMWGVGGQTEQALRRVGLLTIADLAAVPVEVLCRAVGVAAGRHLAALARGDDPRPVVADRKDKSMSAERTFGTDISSRPEIDRQMADLCATVGRRLRSHDLVARTVTLKVRYPDFATHTRSRSLTHPTDSDRVLATTAAALASLAGLDGSVAVRLLGVRVEQIGVADGEQLTLESASSSWRDLEGVSDRVRDRFGPGVVVAASSLRSGSVGRRD